MARSNVRRLKRKEVQDDIETLHDRLSEPALLPGEDAELFEAMANAIRRQLVPSGLLQHLACDDIINLRWEILRHRIFRRKSAERWYSGEVLELYQKADLYDGSGRKLTEDHKTILAMGLMSEDPESRAGAGAYFEHKFEVNPDVILADAYAWAPTVKAHDAKLNMLMRQHRAAMQDYLALRTVDGLEAVPDAELAEGPS